MYMAYNIRGTNGSGKTTLAKNLLKRYEHEFIDCDPVPHYYVPRLNLIVVGRYTNPCGGVDAVKATSDELQKFIEESLKKHNVLFEGIIVSTVFQRWYEMASKDICELKIFYLKPELDTCIRRVIERRQAKGNNKPFDERTLVNKYKIIENTVNKFRAKGFWVKELNEASQKEAYKALIHEIKLDLKSQKEAEE